MAAFHAAEGSKTGERDPKDQYETPDDVVEALVRAFGLELSCLDMIYDPCCGTGRVVRSLKGVFDSVPIGGSDIDPIDPLDDSEDFLADDFMKGKVFAGTCGCVTNPPFSHAEEFVRRALQLFNGPVAMLLPADFMWSATRRDWLAGDGRPASQLIIPWRIKFWRRDGTQIPGQAYSHSWVVWPTAELRPSGTTVTSWAELTPERQQRLARRRS